jgi:hypothetical protein
MVSREFFKVVKLSSKICIVFEKLTRACFSILHSKPHYWSIVVEIRITVHYVFNQGVYKNGR